MALRATIDERLAARDRQGAVDAAVQAVRDGEIGIDELYTLVLVPLLVDTGMSWQAGTTQVWEEHFATATVRTIVESLFADVGKAAAAAEKNGKAVVLTTPTGESHDLGLRMLADRLALAGWDSHYIGADTPTEQIAAAARAFDADLVILSAATAYNRVLLRSVVDELRASLPAKTRLGVGGPAFYADRSWPAEELVSEADLGLPITGWDSHAGAPAATDPAPDEGA